MTTLHCVLLFSLTFGLVRLLPPEVDASYQRPSECSNLTVIRDMMIIKDILPLSSRNERPVMDARKPVIVSVSFALMSIVDVIEKEHVALVRGYLLAQWINEFYRWNTSFPHNCVESITVSANDIWVPDMQISNDKDLYVVARAREFANIRMFGNGTNAHRPGGVFEVMCQFDLTYFPFDEQECGVTVESWRLATEHQLFVPGDMPFSMRYYSENAQWAFEGYEIRLRNFSVFTDSRFSQIEFFIKLRRKSGYYLLNVIVPSIVLSLSQLSVFALPVEEGMKIHVALTGLVSYSIFLAMILTDMPRSSDDTPLLSIYINLSMAYICFAILGEGLVFVCLRLAENTKQKHTNVPGAIYQTAKLFASFLFVEFPRCLPPTMGASHVVRQTISEVAIDKPPTDDLRFGQTDPKDSNNAAMRTPEYSETSVDIDMNSRSGSISHPSANGRHLTPREMNKLRQLKWVFIANVVDRLTFVIYISATLLSPIVLFLVIPATISYN